MNARGGADTITVDDLSARPTRSGCRSSAVTDDDLTGGGGDDLLVGDPGNDILDGGPGNNTLVQ